MAIILASLGAVFLGFMLILFVRRVAPIESPQRGKESETGTGAGIAPLDPDAFYHLVIDLIEALGLRVTFQTLHGKGEHDIMARSDAPVTGGLYIIHAYHMPEHGIVDSTRVLHMLETVKAEEAARGIIITSHSFSEEAMKVSDDTRLELIDGTKLSELAQKYLFREQSA